MIGKKFRNPFPLMPTGLIDPKLNQHSLITKKDIFEHGYKSVAISLFLAQHPMSTPDRIHPSKNIKPFVMLALGQDQGLFSLFYPDPSQLGMKTKPCFIGKKEDSFPLTSLDPQEFFLRSFETLLPLPSWLEHNGRSVAAKKTLDDESTAELGAPSIQSHGSAPDTRPLQPHPTGFASNPLPGGFFLSPSPKPSESARQDDPDDPAASFPLLQRPPSHSPSGSISRRSSGLGRTFWQSGMISTLPKEEGGQRSVSRSTPPVSSLPSLIGLLASQICWLLLTLSWHPSRKKFFNVFRTTLYTKPELMSTYL